MIQPPVCLSIAGSDPSGGAGIQGDLKTFAAHGIYGMAAITALTAQNTCEVSGVLGFESSFITEQLNRIYEDIPTDYVKTGMLLNSAIISAIAEFFVTRPSVKLIVDPVMISSSGAELLQSDAVSAYLEKLFPLATLITPNKLETEYLTKIKVASIEDAVRASERLLGLGVPNVLVKGGDTVFSDSDQKLYDVLNCEGQIHVFERDLIGARNSHGTGCALAAAICCRLAKGQSLSEAVDQAGQYVGNALKYAYVTGKGSGSINHLWNFDLGRNIDDNVDSGIS